MVWIWMLATFCTGRLLLSYSFSWESKLWLVFGARVTREDLILVDSWLRIGCGVPSITSSLDSACSKPTFYVLVKAFVTFTFLLATIGLLELIVLLSLEDKILSESSFFALFVWSTFFLCPSSEAPLALSRLFVFNSRVFSILLGETSG